MFRLWLSIFFLYRAKVEHRNLWPARLLHPSKLTANEFELWPLALPLHFRHNPILPRASIGRNEDGHSTPAQAAQIVIRNGSVAPYFPAPDVALATGRFRNSVSVRFEVWQLIMQGLSSLTSEILIECLSVRAGGLCAASGQFSAAGFPVSGPHLAEETIDCLSCRGIMLFWAGYNFQ